MTDVDRRVARREIADTLVRALERRHEILDVIVEAEDYDAAVEAIATTLGTSLVGAEAVLRLSFDRLTKVSRRRIAEELEDLNTQLSFTMGEKPASAGHNLVLRPFAAGKDRDIFAARTDDVRAAARSETCGNRLDRSADFGEAQPEFVIEAHPDSPREHVRVEVVPITGVEYPCADPGLRCYETLRSQCLHDFAHHRARDLEAFYEIRFGRHVRAGPMDSLEDLRAQDRRDLVVAGHRSFDSEPADVCDGAGHGGYIIPA